MKLLKFYAEWCQPCKMLSNVMKDMEFPYPIEEIDVDKNMETAMQFGVRGVPALILVDENNNPTKRVNGFLNEQQLKEQLGL